MFYKAFLFITVLNTMLFANTISFEEEKYISAVQTSVYKQGNIEIEDDRIFVSYRNLNTTYTFYEDYFIVENKDKKEQLNYDDKLELNIFYRLILFVFKEQKEQIDDFFRVLIDKDGSFILIPNDFISNAIEKIEFKKDENILKFLKIYFNNEDYIKIVQH